MSKINFEDNFEKGDGDVLYFEVLIKGKDISVREILRELSLGKSIDELLSSNPDLTISDVHNCLRYAWELVGVIDFEKAIKEIKISINKRYDLANKIRRLKGTPPSSI